MLSLLLLVAGQGQILEGKLLPEPKGIERRLMMHLPDERLNPPKFSPKQKWEFDWRFDGYVQLDPQSPMESLRFRIFSQEHKSFDDRSASVLRMAMRLWEFNFFKLGLDHAHAYNNQVVDFYLCYGGAPGGEQLFGEDDEGGRPHPVNTIYIYDLNSFASPLEMAREVAHEYGHATLLPIGGYTNPEYWANGYLGEKLFLRMLRDELAARRLTSDDVMGASLQSLDQWVKANVDPLVRVAASRDPFEGLKGTSKNAMDAFLGLALYQASILPAHVFARTIQIVGSTSALDYPKAIANAIAEQPSVVLTIPAILKGKAIWVPVGTAGLKGGQVLAKKDGWAKIIPSGTVTLLRAKESG